MTARPSRSSTKTPAKPARAYHHGDLAAALVAQGLSMVEAGDGLDAVSLRAVARQVQVSAAAVYRHFADKDALLAAIAGHGFARINHAFEDALTAAKRRTPTGRLRALGEAYIEFALAYPDLYRLMFGAARPKFRRYESLEGEAGRAWQILGETVAAACPPGSTAKVVNAATVAAWSLVHGYAVLRLEGQLSDMHPDELPDPGSILANLMPREA